MRLQNGNSLVQISLSHLFGGLHQSRIGCPSDLCLDGLIGNMFESGIAKSNGAYCAEDETADVRPVRYASGRTSENGAGKPEEPHVADNVQPAAMQKSRGEVRDGLRVGGNKSVMGQD